MASRAARPGYQSRPATDTTSDRHRTTSLPRTQLHDAVTTWIVADRVRASRAVPLSDGPLARIRAFAGVAPMPSADALTVAEVCDSDAAAVLTDRNQLLRGYTALVQVVACELATWRPHARYLVMRDAALDVPADVAADIRWALTDEIHANKRRATCQAVDRREVFNAAA